MIYLASPYSHPDQAIREERFMAVCKVTARLMQDGHHIFSPIAHMHQVAVAGELPRGFDYWKEYDWWFIQRVDELWVLMLDGWHESVGVTAEVAIANNLGKIIRYLKPDGEEHAGVK